MNLNKYYLFSFLTEINEPYIPFYLLIMKLIKSESFFIFSEINNLYDLCYLSLT